MKSYNTLITKNLKPEVLAELPVNGAEMEEFNKIMGENLSDLDTILKIYEFPGQNSLLKQAFSDFPSGKPLSLIWEYLKSI